MQAIVDRVMLSLKQTVIDPDVRDKVSRYLDLLSSAGKRDPDELAELGTEYVRKIMHGPDARFTGC